MKKPILFTLLLLLPLLAGAQISVDISPEAQITAELTEVQKSELQSIIGKSLDLYRKSAKLKFADRSETIEAYNALFRSPINAQVVTDFDVKSEDVSAISGYIAKVRRNFPAGLNFGLQNPAVIHAISNHDGNNAYRIEVRVAKSIAGHLNKRGVVDPGTITRQLVFDYVYYKDAEDGLAQIEIIRLYDPNAGAENVSQILHLDLGFALAGASSSETQLFDNAAEAGGIGLSSGPQLSLEVGFMSNLISPKASRDKNLFLAVGAGLFFQKVEGLLSDFATEGDQELSGFLRQENSGVMPLATVISDREGSRINLTEEQSMLGLRIPLGVGYRLFSSYQASAFLRLQYVPSLLLSTSGTLTGRGDYQFQITNGNDFNFNTADGEFNPASGFAEAYGIGADQLIEATPELETKFYHGLRLSGMFLKDIAYGSSTIGIGLGAQFYLPLTSPWEQAEDIQNPFLYADRPESVSSGTISTFSEGVRLGYFSLNATVYLKNIK